MRRSVMDAFIAARTGLGERLEPLRPSCRAPRAAFALLGKPDDRPENADSAVTVPWIGAAL